MMNLPQVPFFISPYKEDSGGVDFLGLRQVNLHLIDLFLPGINNVTFYVRPYALMSWIAWAFREMIGDRDVTRSEFIAFREKVEILFNWSHQLNDSGAGMAGNGQVAPHQGEGDISLEFSQWKRNVSWYDAVNYGPSAKIDNGLGFIRQVKSGVFAVTKSGEKLALALNASLSKSPAYAILFNLDYTATTGSIAGTFYDVWRIDKPSKSESRIFCNSLYDEEAIDQPSPIGRRSTSIKLILSALRAINKACTSDELRRFIARSSYPFSSEVKSEDSLAEAHALWRVLQVRQSHRLAFETIFGWAEVQILEFGRAHSIEIVEKLLNLIKKKYPDIELNDWIEDQLTAINISKGEAPTLLIAGTENIAIDIFQKMHEISEEVDDRDLSVIMAIETLLLCSEITKEFMADPLTKIHARDGGSSRISLEYWMKFVEGNKSLPFQSFISKVIENFILSQHFGVAAARYSDGKQRLRLSIEEGGIVSMLNNTTEALIPSVTRDRLDTILSLMHDAGLLLEEFGEDELWRYTNTTSL